MNQQCLKLTLRSSLWIFISIQILDISTSPFITVSGDPDGAVKSRSDVSERIRSDEARRGNIILQFHLELLEIQMECRNEIMHRENCWNFRDEQKPAGRREMKHKLLDLKRKADRDLLDVTV